MEKQTKFYLTIPFVAVATLGMLAVPLVAMQFGNEVRWSVTDFMLMGVLIFGTGSLLVVVLRSHEHIAYRGGMIIAIGSTFLMIWANLAVGLIGSGPNAANLMYIGVIAVLTIGVYLSKFKPAGMERAMVATSVSVVLVGAVSLLMNMQRYTDTSVSEIISMSLFFTVPYVVAALLFRFVGASASAR